ncbi:hypothetical protein Nepgr_007454 [Nepenthes gracilis]|uniref:Uncharacterized protein n=1 Tax=Nepenthes gracilis TaxID=150966 RepID=A0AAD3S784_NEPGR|nr:hypothetical protein Nepgr_007454 [Nepenthes gracilis]
MIHISKEKNGKANRLVRAAAIGDPGQYAWEICEVLKILNINDREQEIMQITDANNWMIPYVKYLFDGVLQENLDKAKRLTGWYTIMDEKLYRRGYLVPYQDISHWKRLNTPLESTPWYL